MVIDHGEVTVILEDDGTFIEERHYTVKEIAAHLRIAAKTVYEFINSGDLEAYSFGGCKRVKGKALNDFVADCKFDPEF